MPKSSYPMYTLMHSQHSIAICQRETLPAYFYIPPLASIHWPGIRPNDLPKGTFPFDDVEQLIDHLNTFDNTPELIQQILHDLI